MLDEKSKQEKGTNVIASNRPGMLVCSFALSTRFALHILIHLED